jgi:hypothetical protein
MHIARFLDTFRVADDSRSIQVRSSATPFPEVQVIPEGAWDPRVICVPSKVNFKPNDQAKIFA